MIADNPQRAIFDDSARYHRFLEYRVCGDAERSRAARADTGSYLFAPGERALAEAIGSNPR